VAVFPFTLVNAEVSTCDTASGRCPRHAASVPQPQYLPVLQQKLATRRPQTRSACAVLIASFTGTRTRKVTGDILCKNRNSAQPHRRLLPGSSCFKTPNGSRDVAQFSNDIASFFIASSASRYVGSRAISGGCWQSLYFNTAHKPGWSPRVVAPVPTFQIQNLKYHKEHYPFTVTTGS
jgi:hypothetical protein